MRTSSKHKYSREHSRPIRRIVSSSKIKWNCFAALRFSSMVRERIFHEHETCNPYNGARLRTCVQRLCYADEPTFSESRRGDALSHGVQ